jgi:hypothetical protein
VAEPASAHLDDELLGGSLQAQTGQREAQLVVEVAMRHDRSGQCSGQQILCPCLAVRAGHRQHRGAYRVDDVPSQSRQGDDRVQNDNRGCGGRPRPEDGVRSGDVIVAVGSVADGGHEQAA